MKTKSLDQKNKKNINI